MNRNIIVAQDGIILFADASVHKEKMTRIGVATMVCCDNLLQAFGTSNYQYIKKVITSKAITICMELESAKKRRKSIQMQRM